MCLKTSVRHGPTDARSHKNFAQLTELIATSGQPTAQQFQLIADHDYQHIINLGMLSHDDALTDEDQIVTSTGMTYTHIPVIFSEPKKQKLKYFCQLMAALEGERVFVHCIMNYRVSAFMYHYLSKILGLSHQEALSPMLQQWSLEAQWVELMSWTSEDIGLH